MVQLMHFSKEAHENMLKIGNHPTPPKPPDKPYVFTEIINVSFAEPVDVEDASTYAAQLWTVMIDAYRAEETVTRVWWGEHLDSRQRFKIVVDWQSMEGRRAFYASPGMLELVSKWQTGPIPMNTEPPDFYVFENREAYRQRAFGPPHNYGHEDAVILSLQFDFASSWPQESGRIDEEDKYGRTKKRIWSNLMDGFRMTALRSDGAQISDRMFEGWSSLETSNCYAGEPRVSFAGIIRFYDPATAKQFLESLREPNPGWGFRAVKEMLKLAERGFRADIVRMKYVGD